MSVFSKYRNFFPVKKSISLGAIPTPVTVSNMKKDRILENDIIREERASRMEDVYDEEYKKLIEKILSSMDNKKELKELISAYEKRKEDRNGYADAENDFVESISKALSESEEYKNLCNAEYFSKELPKKVSSEIADLISKLNFGSFETHRKTRTTLFGVKDGSVAKRIGHDNFLIYMDNCAKLENALSILGKETLEKYVAEMGDASDITEELIYGYAEKENYISLFSQKAIDDYNLLINGYTVGKRTKIKGINELINEHNQQEKEKEMKLAFLSKLQKLPLFDATSYSVIPESFSSDSELIESIDMLYNKDIGERKSLKSVIENAAKIFLGFSEVYDLSHIYINPKKNNAFSKNFLGKWNILERLFKEDFAKKNESPKLKGKKLDKLVEDAYKNKVFSFTDVEKIADMCDGFEEFSIEKAYIRDILDKALAVSNAYNEYKAYMEEREKMENAPAIKRDNRAAAVIRELCLAVKECERSLIYILHGEELIEVGAEGDAVFYEKFNSLAETIKDSDRLYNKIRNFVSQTKVSEDKTRLMFNNDEFLKGWSDSSKKGGAIIRDGKEYYLICIMKGFKGIENIQSDGNDLDLMEYNFTGDVSKCLGKNLMYTGMKNKSGAGSKYVYNENSKIVADYGLTEDVFNAYQNGIHTKGYADQGYTEEEHKDALRKIIRYFNKALPLAYSGFDAEGLRDDYETFNEYCNELNKRNFTLGFRKASRTKIDEYEKAGYIYKFRIWCRDFSEKAYGIKQNYALIFNALFNEKNEYYSKIRLCGSAKLIFVKASIKDEDKVVHKAGQPIRNKNPKSGKPTSTYSYDIIKDRRKLKDHYIIQLPYEINRQALGNPVNLNAVVLDDIRNGNLKSIVSIKTGQDNLLWVCVTDMEGNIKKQYPLNVIDNNDYREKISARQNEMKSGNKEWRPGADIKSLKEGYLTLAIRKIVDAVFENDAILLLESSNGNKKEKTFGVDTRLYDRLADMLQVKLHYCFSKRKPFLEEGGLLNAYQLCGALPTGDKKKKVFQNGIVFFTNTAYTKNTDPITGFVPPVIGEYLNLKSAISIISNIKEIGYEKGQYYLLIDKKMYKNNYEGKTDWKCYIAGERIVAIRDDSLARGRRYEKADIGKIFADFLKENGIDANKNIKEQILERDDKPFFASLLEILNNVFRMNNGHGDENFFVSPVKNDKGLFFDSRISKEIPCTDANAAYNMARKMVISIEKIKNEETKTIPTTAEYLERIQK